VVRGNERLGDLKHAAGNPLPYRASAAIFWWAAGWWTLASCGRIRGSVASATLFIVAIAAGLLFYGLIIARRLLLRVLRLWLVRPYIGLSFLAWLFFGNPLRGTTTDRLAFVASVGGLAFVLLRPFLRWPC